MVAFEINLYLVEVVKVQRYEVLKKKNAVRLQNPDSVEKKMFLF
jgi:hypothetical protein